MSNPKPTVGCKGAGVLGAAIMERLIESGFTVLVWNRNPDKLTPLLERGASAAGAPMPLMGLVTEPHRKAIADGLGDRDNSEFVRLVRDRA